MSDKNALIKTQSISRPSNPHVRLHKARAEKRNEDYHAMSQLARTMEHKTSPKKMVAKDTLK
jgi:hypothetical protein